MRDTRASIPPAASVWAGIVPYGAAALMVLAATAGTYAIRNVMGNSMSILFFPAVLFSAIYGGYGPALLATVLSTATLAYIVIRPHTSFEIGADDLIRLGIFAVVAMVTASISSARKRAEDAQRQALDELQGALEILQQVAVREERLRLARDLHDGVLQSFTGIRLRLEALAGNPDAPPSARETLRAVERAIAIEQRELRSFIENLKPLVRPAGTAGAVAPVLEELRERLALEWHTPIALRVNPEGLSIPAADYQTLRLIVREAIVNALKHAEPTRVSVDVKAVGADRLEVVVSNDGRGFPFRGRMEHDELAATNAGPVSLRERLVSLGGSLAVESTTAGSRVEMMLPLC